MEIRLQAVAIVQRAEGEIRELLLRAAAEGDYEHAVALAEWAKRLRQMVARPGTPMGPTEACSDSNGHSGIRNNSNMPTPRSSGNDAPKHSRAGKPSKSRTRKTAAYPRFWRDREELVKIGWSKKQRKEYRHKAPKTAVLLVTQAVEQNRASGERFTFEDLLPIRDPRTGTDVPSYQAYAALAWLRQEALVVQHGRQGYSLAPNINLMDAVEERWKLLPKA